MFYNHNQILISLNIIISVKKKIYWVLLIIFNLINFLQKLYYKNKNIYNKKNIILYIYINKNI